MLAPLYRRRRRPFRPALSLPKGLPAPSPGVGQTRLPGNVPFIGDGFVFPRSQDNQFDIGIRVPQLATGATTEQTIFQQRALIKGGRIRGLGCDFNSPHGFLQVRVTILINNAPSSGYLFQTVDAATGAYQGSLPPFQIGSVDDLADVNIFLPPNARVSVRFVNNSTEEPFTCIVRLWGWTFNE